MDSILFCIPLKDNSTEKLKTIYKEMAEDADAYREMLQRYDLHSAKAWINTLDGKDYVMVYHDVGPDCMEKMQTWENSDHPYDQQLNEKFMTVYDQGATEGSSPLQILDFKV